MGLRGRCLRLNPAMGSDWKINSFSRLMLTNVLNRVGHTIMALPDSLHPVTRVCHNSIWVLTNFGAILDFKGPIKARDILDDHPGLYYLLPLSKEHKLCKNGVTEQVKNIGIIEQLKAEWMGVVEPAKMSSYAASDFVDNLANGSTLEVLPTVGDGVWRVKLVIDTKQLEEILSKQVNTEALIEKMRMVASSASLTPKRIESAWGMS
ncbi:hypothetical protein RGQ29_010712 [Quercus rubra]|uniref:Uncharacterized protein n=1 Tax=Quercus rubra TaxID=3512 RepID=A0AAN7J7N0_QUERU|nr:hypothetical protein RGQ29_010712 [Quercus rubra]